MTNTTPLYREQTAEEIRLHGYGMMICTLCGRAISSGGLGLRNHAAAHAREGTAAVIPEQYVIIASREGK